MPTKAELETRVKELEAEVEKLQAELASASSPSTPGYSPAVVLSPQERAQQEHALRLSHNERTGGGKIQEDELQMEREKHNSRTGDVSR